MRALALSQDVVNFVDETRLIAFSLDASGDISNWNRQISLLTGYSSEELVGSPLKVKNHLAEYISARDFFHVIKLVH
jgi:PAS domain S-box-containing protein